MREGLSTVAGRAGGPAGGDRARRKVTAAVNRARRHAWAQAGPREGPAGDQLKGWPKAMRVFARRERPHPGAQLSLFETADGWRYSLWATNLPAGTRG